MIDDGVGAAGEQIGIGAGQFAAQLHLQAFCRQLNRRQRIFDFMRQTPRHLAPCGRALRRHQCGYIVADDQVTRLAADFQPGATHQEAALHWLGAFRLVRGRHTALEFDLPLPRFASLARKRCGNFSRKFGQARQLRKWLPLRLFGIKAENRLRALVCGRHTHVGVEHQYASGQAGENVFDIGLG